MPLAARTERALLDAFGLEPSAEGRRALAASLRAAADVVDGDAASPSSEPAPPPRVDDGADAGPPAPASRAARGFDVREYPSAYVALRVMYAGWDYRGFAQQGSDGVRTVEGALFSALRRTRLIAPDAAPEDVAYTRCGRTDAGVSALGQIVSLRLRSKRGTKGRKRREETNEGPCDPLFSSDDASDDAKRRSELRDESRNDGAPRGASSGDRRAARSDSTHPPPGGVFFAEHAEDELDYCALLNRALPEDVRVTGWGYVHESFSARFDCEFRLYKYFFCAFPDSAERSAGPLVDEGDEKSFPEKLSGLDLDAMRDAARRFEGTHDFRNLCKMDARNVHNYVRTVYRCDVVDAADARVGLWVTHVFPDFVVRALLAASGSDTGGALSKRQALDAARAALEKEHPKVALSFAGAAARAAFFTKNTNGAFADVLRSLRRRYDSDEKAPFCVLTKKAKKQRLYTCVLRGSSGNDDEGGVEATDGWDAVFGRIVAKEKTETASAGAESDAAAAMRARREARRGTMRLAAVKRDGVDVSADAKDAARRARAEGW